MNHELPNITSKIEDGGFVDLCFRITDRIDNADGSILLVAEGLHEERHLGLRVSLVTGMKPGVVNGEIDQGAFRRDAVTFQRLDERSDAFVSAVHELYGATDPNASMREQLVFTAIALAGDPAEVESQHLNFKLFHDDEDRHGEYCELFLHIDLPLGEVEIHEKDDEYRPNVLKSLLPRAGSWSFRCEQKDNVSLPPEYTFAQSFNYLNAANNSFYILTRPDGSYMQCGGGKDRCAVEMREVQDDGSYSHFVVGKVEGSSAAASIQMSAGEIQVLESEVLDRWDAIDLFKAYFAGEDTPEGYVLRPVEM